MKRKASAVWNGDLKSGRGQVSTESTVLKDAKYSFATRFENGPGTNPEELIAAAHSACFSMALSAELSKAGFVPDSVNTTATVNLENHPQTSWTVTAILLETRAKVPNITPEKFAEVAAGAKVGCPISRLLKAAEITLDAKLV
jgi:osmotically inducible protein OsmC